MKFVFTFSILLSYISRLNFTFQAILIRKAIKHVKTNVFEEIDQAHIQLKIGIGTKSLKIEYQRDLRSLILAICDND